MKSIQRVLVAVFIVSVALLSGCASLPSTEVMRAEVAAFQLPKAPDQGKAVVYVVRPSSMGGLIRFNVFLDDQAESSEMGYTRAEQYIYFSVPPGSHRLYSKAENWAEISISVKAGDVVFVQQEPVVGVVMARNNLLRIEEVVGKYYVKTLAVGTIHKTEK